MNQYAGINLRDFAAAIQGFNESMRAMRAQWEWDILNRNRLWAQKPPVNSNPLYYMPRRLRR